MVTHKKRIATWSSYETFLQSSVGSRRSVTRCTRMQLRQITLTSKWLLLTASSPTARSWWDDTLRPSSYLRSTTPRWTTSKLSSNVMKQSKLLEQSTNLAKLCYSTTATRFKKWKLGKMNSLTSRAQLRMLRSISKRSSILSR